MSAKSLASSLLIRSGCTLTVVIAVVISCLFISTRLLAAPPYQTVAPGNVHACALDFDGNISCEAVLFARRLLPVDETTGFRDIVAGASHTCGIRQDETVVCWGDNGFGQLDVPGNLQLPLRDIDASSNYTCALDAGSQVVCWGLDDNARLTLPYPEGEYASISVSRSYGCLIDTASQPVCAIGEVGLPDNATPPVGLDSVVHLDVYSSTADTASLACALDADGEITCWGQFLTSVAPFDAGPYSDIAVNAVAACALTTDGALDCNLNSNSRQFLQDEFVGSMPAGNGFVDVVSGPVEQMCVIDTEGRVQCWGTGRTNAPFTQTDLPQAPVLSVSVYSDTTAELLWNQDGFVPFGARYEILRNDELLVTTENNRSFLDTTLEPGIIVEYNVVLLSIDGTRSEPSNTVTVDTDAIINPGPVAGYVQPNRTLETSGLRADVYGGDTVELFWDRETFGVRGYEIRKDGEFIGFTDGTSFLDDSPTANKPDYDVIAVDNDGSMLGFASIEVQLAEGVGVGECT